LGSVDNVAVVVVAVVVVVIITILLLWATLVRGLLGDDDTTLLAGFVGRTEPDGLFSILMRSDGRCKSPFPESMRATSDVAIHTVFLPR
jgi:hypothetical protein